MERTTVLGLAIAVVLVSGLNTRADFVVDFDGPAPSPPFVFNNQFLWDTPEPGLATMRTNQGGAVQQETNLNATAVPDTWDPSVAGTYEISCMVVNHATGLGAGGLDFFYADKDWSWTITWTQFFVSLDIQWAQIEVPATADEYSLEMDTTDDFHCYEVEWDPNVPSAKLFVDDEFTGIEMREDSAPPTGEPAPPREGAPNSCSATLTAGLPVVKSYTTPTASQR